MGNMKWSNWRHGFVEADIERMEADAAWENQEMDQKMSARRHRRLSAADRPQYSAVIRTGKRAGAASGDDRPGAGGRTDVEGRGSGFIRGS